MLILAISLSGRSKRVQRYKKEMETAIGFHIYFQKTILSFSSSALTTSERTGLSFSTMV
jgi:hypothetical protein